MASTVHAVEANLFSLLALFSKSPHVAVLQDDHLSWALSDVPFPLFNSVSAARLPKDHADRLIAERVEDCRRRRVPMLWWTGPSTEPADLGERLMAAGFVNEPAAAMAMPLKVRLRLNTAGTGVMLHMVRDQESLDVWSRTLCSGFGAPPSYGAAFAELVSSIGFDVSSPFRHFLGTLNGQPVATASVFHHAGVSGLYDVSTVPERRRRGIGRLMTEAALLAAQGRGSHTAVLLSSKMGESLYHSMGFRKVCDFGQYVWADHPRR